MTDSQINPDLHGAYWELYAARPEYERAEAFYCGTVDEVYASNSVRKLLSKSGYTDMDDFNFAHIPVDVISNKLNLQSVTTERPATNHVLEDLWDYNELGEVLPQLHLDACKYGDSYLMAWPSVDDKGNVIAVDMTLQSPMTVRVFYDPENDRIQLFALKSWCEGSGKDMIVRANLYYADRIERWFHKGKVPSDPKKAKWQPYVDENGDAILTNPTGIVPFFHYRTARTYGVPEHMNAYGPQLSINKIIASMNAALDFQAFPQRYLLLDPAVDNSNGNTDVNPFFPEDEGQIPQHPDNMSTLTANPGAVWEVLAKQAGQFQAADMQNFLGPLDRSIKAMAQATQIPMHAFESSGDAISGESRRLADEPVNARVKRRQLSMGSTHRRAFAFALDLLGIDSEGISVTWEPLESVQDKEGWEVMAAKVLMGVPLEIVFQEAGYSSQQAAEWAANKEVADAKAAADLAAQAQAQMDVIKGKSVDAAQLDNSSDAPSGK